MNQTVDDETVGIVTFTEYLTYRGVTYGASSCVINIALVQMDALAVFTQKEGEDKEIWASTDSDCQDFLEKRGCPRRLALCLIKMAQDHEYTEVMLAQPTKAEVTDGQKEKA